MSEVHDKERKRLETKAWIQTFSGGRFYPLDPKTEDVRIDDIAHALALHNRFTGHTRFPYSVAQHSVLVSYIVPPWAALAGLLHDAAEAYLPDLAAPIKGRFLVDGGNGDFPLFKDFEGRVTDVIFNALGLGSVRAVAESPEVKRGDLIALATEARDLLTFVDTPGEPSLREWALTEEPRSTPIHAMSWEEAKAAFLARFEELV